MRYRTMYGALAMAVLLTAPLLMAPRLASGADRPLRILVYGGTGMIGQRIVNEALARGDIVTAVVRKPAADSAARARLTMLAGNVLDTAQVVRQIADQDVVIEAVRSDRGGRSTAAAQGAPPAAPIPHFYRRVAQSLISAARQLGAHQPRLLFVGGASSLKDRNGRLLIDEMPGVSTTSEFYLMKEALDYLRTVHDVSWTVLTPALQIAPGIRTGKFRLGGDTLIRAADGSSRISAEDYAVAMLDEAHHPQHVRARFTLGY